MNLTAKWKKFLKGLLILLAAPCVVLALFAAYVYVANARPQEGALRTRVEPAVVLPGGEATYYVDVRSERDVPDAPPPPIDIAFLIDVSGSMTDSLPDMAEAAHIVAEELASESPGRIRFALIRFDSQAEIATPWTEDPKQLFAGLKQLRPLTGQNDTRPAFARLDELLGRARAGAKRVAIFYTDGALEACGDPLTGLSLCPGGPMTEAEMRDKAEELRGQGVELYSVGLPGYGSAPLMVQMTGSPAHVFDPVDARDLAANFRMAVRSITGASAEGGQLTHLIDGRHFAVPLQGTAWSLSGRTLTLGVGKLPQGPMTFAHPLVPRSSGLWRVGVEPPRLSYAGDDGRLRNLQATNRPAMLVIGWGALLWALLPSALWSLVFLMRRKPRTHTLTGSLTAPLRARPPALLPAPPADVGARHEPIPTLFVGLGGAGRRALLAARVEAKQAHVGRPEQPYKFLWLDLDTKEAERPTPFEPWHDYEIVELVAPSEVRRTQSYLPEQGRVPDHLKWFNPHRYLNSSREELNLAEGSRGDRALARLALFEWLTRAREPLSTLERMCEELAALPSQDGTRQVVVFATADGGVGGGWLLDVGRLLRRLTRRRQNADGGFAPELIGVLCQTPEGARTQNRSALVLEAEAAALSGAFPQRLTYMPGDELLDAVDTEAPFNWVLTTEALDSDSAAAQSAELAAVLVERHPRASLLRACNMVRPRSLISAQTRALHVLPAQLYEQLHDELFLRIIGPDVLLDIEPTPQGGFAPRVVGESQVARHLAAWANAEPPGAPLQMLLSAAADPTRTAGLLMALQRAAPTEDWFLATFCAALTSRLRGHADPDDDGWHRDWMPGDAVATLRLLAARLEDSVGPDLRATGATTAAVESVEFVAGLARASAAQLEDWVRDFCLLAEKAGARRAEVGRLCQQLGRLSGRTYLEPLDEQAHVARWTQEIFETWLGTTDVTSAVRKHLYFSVSLAGTAPRVVLNSYIESAHEFGSASKAAEALDHQTRLLARVAPAARVGGALLSVTEEKRRELARQLVDTTAAPRQVLVVTPDATALDDKEGRVINALAEGIPQPPAHGTRHDQSGDDHGAVRRIELSETVWGEVTDPAQFTFTADAEREAESLRQRAERKYELAVPAFPPELRIALAQRGGFRSFARAYKAGRVVRRHDAAGVAQWVFADSGEFLTFGAEPTLAQAAANYVWYAGAPGNGFRREFETENGGGSFAGLEEWRRRRETPDADVLSLIAIEVYED
ncbi:MAG: VWA domain-containing protein [Pyrinomonadaceae bacterium]